MLHEISATHVGASLFPAIGDACAMRQIDRCRAGIGLSECNARVRRSARMRAELCAGSQATRLSEGPARPTAPHVSDLPTSRRTVFILMRQSVPAQAAERGHHCAHTACNRTWCVACCHVCSMRDPCRPALLPTLPESIAREALTVARVLARRLPRSAVVNDAPESPLHAQRWDDSGVTACAARSRGMPSSMGASAQRAHATLVSLY